LGIGTAPTEVPGERLAYFGIGRIVVPVQKGFGGNDESRSAVAALHAVMLHIFFNQGMAGCGNTLDRFDLLTITLDSQRHARENRPAVHNDRAGSACAAVTHQLGSGQSEPVVNKVVECPIRFDLEFILLSVDRYIDGTCRFGQRFRCVFRYDMGFDSVE
jgi:hypothetical protein